jgi:predicted amidohydrolase
MKETAYLLGMGQMLVEGGEPQRNLSRAEEMIRQAKEQDCRIVVLPECLDLGWTSPAAREEAQPVPGKHSEMISSAAREAGVYVVAGLVERAGDRLYNAAVFISPEGEILLKHRKLNELTIAQDLYATGDRLSIVETPLGTIGVNICADNFPNSLVFAHSLARMGCQVLLSPCAWAADGDHDNEKQPYGALWMESYTTLAKLYDITVAGVSNVGWLTAGPWKGRKCIGCSLAVGPGGEVLARGPYGENAEALLVVKVKVKPREVTGTAIADMLSNKGYTGP